MSKFSRELYDLIEKSYMEDYEPIQLSFSNRIYKKYGKEFNKKYDYISGKNSDYIAEKLKNTDISQLTKVTNSIESGALSAVQNMNKVDFLNSKQEYIAPQMYVPEEIRHEWVELDTKKYFIKDENKRELIEEYLSTLSEANRKKAIAVMCENTNSKNYYRFLDLSTTAYTPNQIMLSNDLIKYFENKYLNEFIDRQQVMQRFNKNIFNKQEQLEKTNSFDPIYNETVANQNYYNPYDKNEILMPKISANRQFLDKNRDEDKLFEIIDKNSALYLKQQTEFNNNHLNKTYIRDFNQQKLFDNKQEVDQYIHANNEPLINEKFIINTPSNEQYYNNYTNQLNNNHQSYIIEIPKVDNIAEFIEQRNLLNYRNTLRKHHNINQSLDFNNSITNSNLFYNPIEPKLRISKPQQNQLNLSQQANMHDQMGSIYQTELNQNMMNDKTSMQIAQENIANDETNQSNVEHENEPTINKIIKLSKNSATTSKFDNNYGINQLDPNANNRVEQIRENSRQQSIDKYSPNIDLFNNRFNQMNSYVNYQPSNNISRMQLNVNSFRVAEIDRIQKFFETKPVVIKKPSPIIDEDSFEISEEIPIVERKKQARAGKTKKEKRANNSQNAIRIVKINNGIVNKKTNSIEKEKKTERVQAKKVLV